MAGILVISWVGGWVGGLLIGIRIGKIVGKWEYEKMEGKARPLLPPNT